MSFGCLFLRRHVRVSVRQEAGGLIGERCLRGDLWWCDRLTAGGCGRLTAGFSLTKRVGAR